MRMVFIAFGISTGINMAMFLVAYRFRTDKLTDASYALTFITLTVYGLLSGPLTAFRLVLFGMITLWAIRLGGFLLFRIWHSGKDSRFDDMRANFLKFGKFWLSQALAVWIILIPTLLAFETNQATLGVLCFVAIGIWVLGTKIEAIADLQKYRFTRNPKNKGQWIATGLWAYSRHPNYFGEITLWIGVYLYAVTALPLPHAIAGLASPLFIAALLLFISGIPPLEKSADAKWGSQTAYRQYKKQTSILLLLPRKK